MVTAEFQTMKEQGTHCVNEHNTLSERTILPDELAPSFIVSLVLLAGERFATDDLAVTTALNAVLFGPAVFT